MSTQEVVVTEEGLKTLREQLAHLTEVRRPEIAQRIKEARELGDLKENAEYHDAKNEQGFIEAKIVQLEGKIRHAKIVEAGDASIVGIGTAVEVEDLDSGDIDTYSIVGAGEADPLANKISNDSPIAQTIMGKKPNDEVEVQLPRGVMRLKIRSISLG